MSISKATVIKDAIYKYFVTNRERKGIEKLYAKVFPKVQNYIRKNGGHAFHAEDIFHDVLLVLIEKIKSQQLDESVQLESYLFTMIKNAWINKVKRDDKIRYSTDTVASDTVLTTSNDFDQQEKEKVMDEVLKSLGDTCRDILKLTYYQNYSLKEAAEIIGLSNAEVAKTYQYRCKKKLFNKVKENVPFRTLMGI